MRSELSRFEERLEDAKQLEKFLEDLTPLEWREGLVAAHEARHAEKVAAWQAQCAAIKAQQQV